MGTVDLFIKIIMTLLIILVGIFIYGIITQNFVLMLIGGVPVLIGCVIALVIFYIQLWTL